ncbi:sensor histidine kinase [Asticcacaulis sp.]|uniref:sensor histidine kinase n=1 Tax=Asticcacaulis sp. TaxID=1872648 RepID=UPI003F7C5FF9
MHKRYNSASGVNLANDIAPMFVAHNLLEDAPHAAATDRQAHPRRSWLHYSNLKVEAAIFLLIALTFAAVLGQKAITSRHLDLTSRVGQYYPFVYGDRDDGGNSSIDHDTTKPLVWSCDLREGAKFVYCGYGVQFEAPGKGKGIDFSKYKNVTIRLTYHGVGDHLRLLLQNTAPATLGNKIKPGETMPFVAEFPVTQGVNEIHLNTEQFAVEQWWLTSHGVTADEAGTDMDAIVSLAFSSGSQTPHGKFDVKVSSLAFHGVSLSTDQWYLIILGIWLILTGGFLVFRFLRMRRLYEARQRQQAEESRLLAEARAAAEAASSAKSQFLANMSHELRTPLNAILGYAQLLKTTKASERDLAAIQTIEHSGEHLLTMITDILDIAKVEAGRLELLPGVLDIRQCVLNVAQMVRLRAEEKGLLFTVHIANDVPRLVVADQKRIRQVLINLLGNAIKFTPSGEIHLEACYVASATDDTRLRFCVTDTGIGISPDQLLRIFQPFEQAGNAIDKSGGTGLGLSITYHIVQMMGGDIRVESGIGSGSRFIVEVPFDRADEEMARLEARDAVAVTSEDSATPPRELEAGTPLVAPFGPQLDHLLFLARAGNLRAIRKAVPEIIAAGPEYRGFAERLDSLAAAYQSPAVLRLIEVAAKERDAA